MSVLVVVELYSVYQQIFFNLIRSIRMSHGTRRTKDVKKFIYYSLYAWGFPCFATLMMFVMDENDWLPDDYKPNVAKSNCWLGKNFNLKKNLCSSFYFAENSKAGHFIFFLAPVGLQITINVVLFIITAVHCNRVKSEIHRMQMNDTVEQKKRRYIADKAM